MSVYLIASYDIVDNEVHNQYIFAADPLLEAHGG